MIPAGNVVGWRTGITSAQRVLAEREGDIGRSLSGWEDHLQARRGLWQGRPVDARRPDGVFRMDVDRAIGVTVRARHGRRRKHRRACRRRWRPGRLAGRLSEAHSKEIIEVVNAYGPFPSTEPLRTENLMPRLVKDKKAIQGTVHFVLATGIGTTEVVPGLPAEMVREAIELTLA